MHLSLLFFVLPALAAAAPAAAGAAAVSATPTRAAGGASRAAATPTKAPPPATAAEPTTPPAPGAAAAMNPQCAIQQMLAAGIAQNILAQNGELASVTAVGEAVARNDNVAFGVARNQLMTFIANGIAIRQTNQLIAPQGNAAAPGLAFVANAQLGELNLAMNLTGVAANDNSIVATLKMNFSGGIRKNMENQALAMKGC